MCYTTIVVVNKQNTVFEKVFHNGVIRTMVVIEFFFAIALGLFTPMFAIFAADKVVGGSAAIAGFGMAIFWGIKAVFQMPVASYLDKIRGEYDDFYAYIIGQVLFALGMFLYLFASTAAHVYLLQALLGIAFAINMPAFYGVFSRHLDEHYESSEWSVYSVFSYSMAVAIAGAVSGMIVDAYGFSMLFILAGSFFLVAAIVNALLLRPRIAGRSERPPAKMTGLRDHDGI